MAGEKLIGGRISGLAAAWIVMALWALISARVSAEDDVARALAIDGARYYELPPEAIEAAAAGDQETFNKAVAAVLARATEEAEENPDDGQYRRQLGAVYIMRGENAAAEKELRAAISLDGDNADTRLDLAHVLQQAGRHDEAFQVCAIASRLDPKNWRAHFGLGSAFLHKKQDLPAEGCFREAARLAPENPNCRQAFGRVLLLRGKFDDAVEELLATVKLTRLHAETHAFLGLALFLQDKDIDSAIGYCRDAIRLDEDNTVALGTLAASLRKSGDFVGAEETCREFLRLEPQSARGLRCLGEYLALQKKHREAIEPLREAIRLNPKDALAYKQLGICLLELFENTEEAIGFLRKADHLAPGDSETQMRIGVALARLGQIEQAERAMRTAVALDPYNAHAHYGLGEVLHRRGDETAAIAAFREAVQLECDSPDTRDRLAILLAESGDLEGALETLQDHVSESYDPAWAKLKVEEFQRRLANAPRIASALHGEVEPSDANEASLFAAAAYDGNEYLRAAQWWLQAFEADPSLFTDFTLRRAAGAAVLATVGESDLADEDKTKWRRQALAWIERRRAECAAQLSGAPSAAKQCEHSLFRLRYFSDLAEVRDDSTLKMLPAEEVEEWREMWRRVDADRAALLKCAAEPYDELAELRKAAEAKPNDAQAQFALGAALINEKDYAGAESPFREAVRLAPDDAVKRRYLALALAYANKLEDGLAQVDEAIRLTPDDAENYITRALCFNASESHRDQMIESAKAALQLAPDAVQAMILLGGTLLQSEESAAAEEVLRRALLLEPNNDGALKALSISLSRQEKFSEAVDVYQRLIRIEPKSASSYHYLGVALVELKRPEEAVHAFREAHRLRPDALEPLAGLVYVLIQEDRDLEAEPVCREAIVLDPENAFLRQMLGMSLLERDEFEEAIESLRMAIAIEPADPQSHVLLGAALEERGDRDAALESYRRAVDLAEPNSKAALLIADRIKAITNDKANR